MKSSNSILGNYMTSGSEAKMLKTEALKKCHTKDIYFKPVEGTNLKQKYVRIIFRQRFI